MMKIFGSAGQQQLDLPAHLQQANACWRGVEVFLAQYGSEFVPPALSEDNQQALCLAGEVFAPAVSTGQAPNQAVLDWLWRQGQGMEQIDGNFALAWWNNQQQCLTLARDQLGAAPLYYAMHGNTLLFASKLKDITGISGFDCQLDMQALTAFIKYNFIPGSYTIYRRIKKLPPGHMLRFKDGQISISKYFDTIAQVGNGLANTFTDSDELLTTQLQQLLREKISQQLKPLENPALLLSGGVDSSLMAALLQEQGLRHAVTIGFSNQAFDESVPAARVADHLGLRHTLVTIGQNDILDTLENMYDIYEEPYADASQVPTSFALKTARERLRADTAFVGDAGDDFFMGVSEHDQHMLYGIPANPLSGRHTLGSYARYPKRYFSHLLFNKDVDFYNKWKANRLYRKTLLNPQEPDAFYREMAPVNTVGDHLRRALTFEAMVAIPGIIAIKCNRPAEFYGLNLRSPLLNPDVFIFAQHLPRHMLFNNGKRKYILLKLLERYFPAQFFERRKAGFSVPLNDWLKGPMRAWAEEMIAERRLREQGLFNVKFIRKIWETNSRHLEKMWGVFMFQAWWEKNKP